ncbi:MAG TPA: PadR family transcriptional regulator [Solirubrobacteraceae bacterium]|nr:PadR family transcriptional regulator [Solirubrobacteraceae bacterium]
MGKDLRTGWLLFLLSTSCSYGYELRRELELRGLSLDAAVLYRSLRDMESSALITSHWMRSGEGPRRRIYKITAAGEAELARVAASVADARDAHDTFLSAYHGHGHGTSGSRHRA